MKALDIAGQRFGRLTVLDQVLEPHAGSIRWRCRCECGKIAIVSVSKLRHGHTRSCGCLHHDIISKRQEVPIGAVFGNLVVVAEKNKTYRKNSKAYAYLCRCTCGRSAVAEASKLLGGRATACQVCKREKGSKNARWNGCGEISGSCWNRVKANAKVRKLSLNVTIQNVWDLFLHQNRKCALTGTPLVFSTKSAEQNASLDRIDSSVGYEPDNIQWVLKDVNKMKVNLPEEHFIGLCRKIVAWKDSNQ
jgi:hypothetical protein